MTRRFLLWVSIGMAGLLFFSCERNPAGPEDEPEEEPEETLVACELFRDPSLENGVSLHTALEDGRDSVNFLPLGNGSGEVSWTLRFEDVQHNLTGATAETTSRGITFSNGVHTLARNGHGVITLILDASKEYDPSFDDLDDISHAPVPTLLLETAMDPIPLKGMKKLELQFDERVDEIDNQQATAFVPVEKVHHFAHSYFLFDFSYYDPYADRNRKLELRVGKISTREDAYYPLLDIGNGAEIYWMPGVNFYNGGVLVEGSFPIFTHEELLNGLWRSCHLDLLELITYITHTNIPRGYQYRYHDASPEEFTLTKAAFCFAAFGKIYSAIQLRNLSLVSEAVAG